MKIAVDFDGTVVEHTFPTVGPDCPGAQRVLRRLAEEGHKIILYTMRSDKYLADAIEWFENNGIHLYGIQMDPKQITWTNSKKCHADLFIDDRNLAAPLTHPADGRRPYIDWRQVEDILIRTGVLKG